MSSSFRAYSEAEKAILLEEFKKSDESIAGFTKRHNIPSTTFRGWLKANEEDVSFGAIEIRPTQPQNVTAKSLAKTMIFVSENIRIELKENFDKAFLRRIVEVLINDN